METEMQAATATNVIGSVVIPAYNEAAIIRRCLDALFTGIDPSELQVLVVCNGCSDNTAEIARSSGYPIDVIELPKGGKTGALNAADATISRFPRVYLDADVALSGSSVRRLLQRLSEGVPAVRPPVKYDTSKSSRLVRSYYRTRAGLPVVDASLWGAHVYGLSDSARARFGDFPESPELMGEDLWLDRGFRRTEIEVVDCDPVVIPTSRRARDLVFILRRMYRAKDDPMPPYTPEDRPDDTRSTTLRDLRMFAIRSPRNGLDAAVYCGFAIVGRVARVFATRSKVRWERDDSVRG